MVNARAWTNRNLTSTITVKHSHKWPVVIKQQIDLLALIFFLINQLKKLQERFAKEEELRKELEEKLTKLMEEKNELFQNLQSVRRVVTGIL